MIRPSELLGHRLRFDKMHPAVAAILLGAVLVGQSGALRGLGSWAASRGETVRVVIDLADPKAAPTYTADAVGFNDWFRP